MNKFSKTILKSGMSGAEIARDMLKNNGIYDVEVTHISGTLTDHYDPTKKTVNLSNEIYYGCSTAAAAVAAHECGHAVQHAKGYAFLQMRSKLVPIVSFSSRFISLFIFIGFLVMRTTLFPLQVGIVLFALTTLFSFITLPVEVDASNRALEWIKKNKVVSFSELKEAKEALTWAALTYVIAALASLAELFRLISILNKRNDD